MKERPILFSAPMVHAILSGEKTQTRRALSVKYKYLEDAIESAVSLGGTWSSDADGHGGLTAKVAEGTFAVPMRCPYGAVGGRLWVKEAIARFEWMDGGETSVGYVATPGVMHEDAEWVWKRAQLPGMFMPRGLSRITLEVTDVRVERLQDISLEDMAAEGIRESDYAATAGTMTTSTGTETRDDWITEPVRAPYQRLWERINGAGSWDANPWVWAISFRRIA